MSCEECDYFDGESEICTIEQGSSTRSCVIAINNEFAQIVQPGDDVLEIGCGSWSYLKRQLPKNVNWHGIDLVNSQIVTRLGSVGDIPYEQGSFDYVISNQSIEHWHEFGVPLRRGVSEISRVLSVGGQAWINSALYFHGHEYFVRGELDRIDSLFENNFWEEVHIETWRKDHEPLDAYRPYEWNEIPEEVIPGRPSAVIINIIAEKKETQPTPYSDVIKYKFDSRMSQVFHDVDVLPHYYHILHALRLHQSNRSGVKKSLQKIKEWLI